MLTPPSNRLLVIWFLEIYISIKNRCFPLVCARCRSFLVVIKHAKYKGMPHEPVVAVNIKEVLSCNMLFVGPTQPTQPRPGGREFMKTHQVISVL